MTKGKTVVHINIGERQIEDIQGIDVIVTTKDNTKILYDKWYATEQEEPCGDCISRQAVLDLTWEEPSYTDALNVLTEIRDKIKALPSVTPTDMTFRVIDKKTRKPPIFDHNHIFKEKWFKDSHLIYCDIDCWCISECGDLMLVDDCGNVGYPPTDRFEVVFEPTERTRHWINICDKDFHDYRTGNKLCFECSECRSEYTYKYNYCPNCGARMGSGDNE